MHSQRPSSNQVQIPDWMKKEYKSEQATAKSGSARFLRKTLSEITHVFQNEIFVERFVQQKRLLQQVDPRAKLLTILFFIIFSGLTRSFLSLLILAFVSVLYAMLSGLRIRNFIKRVWLILPTLVIIISIPAATSLFIKGDPLFYFYQGLDITFLNLPLPKSLYISSQGILIVLKMALRMGVSLSFSYLLIMTTRWVDITKSLGILRIPTLIITIITMTYRYIFTLSKLATDMMEARFLRTVGQIGNKHNRNFIANRISFLFIKSSYLSDEVFDAMKCRGFTGHFVSLTTYRFKSLDVLWIINNVIILFILLIGEAL